MVADYSLLNFKQIEDLPIDVYLLLLRDAFIYQHEQTEKGCEYLENCWRIEQEKPERDKIHKRIKKEGIYGGQNKRDKN